MRRAKIVCTLGPASESPEQIEGRAVDAGRVSCPRPFDSWMRAAALWRTSEVIDPVTGERRPRGSRRSREWFPFPKMVECFSSSKG